ncbi:MAG: hypothetical protein GAK30_00133 [Paracidovorax wautersii]|uniref:LTD domain-containing protein n=1 Tax=Paracidovorax wautersii TaxID=1177982 RepID=A0A7V8JRZ1_9BURK|nr:MAG: hypothetical protein GAK30_00133 [Paracidovorax wautersii]
MSFRPPSRIAFAAWLATVVVTPAHAELFFSEYVEGSSNNKALEIFNPDAAGIDLSAYTVEQYNNGNTSPSARFPLAGTLAAGGVYVVAHPTLATQLASGLVQQQASLGFNGNDAVVLKKDGAVVDRIGQVGFDPGTEWRSNGVSTLNQTLRRKAEIATGDTAADTAFDPSVGWLAFAQDDFSGLGLPGQQTATPGGGDPGGGAGVTCGGAHTVIADIQGSAAESPLKGQTVNVEAVVSASYLGSGGFTGFFIQQADDERANRAHTSDGVFVYAPGLAATAVSAGQRIHLRGTVEEFGGQTQLRLSGASNLAVCRTGQTVTPVTLNLPLPDGASFADYEGMYVRFSQDLRVNEVYELARYGSIVLAPTLLQTPTQTAAPGAAAVAVAASNARSRIILDDGKGAQNPDPVIYPPGGLSAANTLRRGYTVHGGVEGVLNMRYSAWRIQPLPGAAVPTFDATGNPRPDAPPRAAGSDLRVASFNVLNYFNGNGQGAGFDDPTNRGAATQDEFERQRAKIVAALEGLDADVVGLMEIENDGYGSNSAVQDLVRQLGSHWAFVSPGTAQLGGDAIAVALIYRQDRVEPVGQAATLAIDDKNRQPLAQTFRALGGGRAVTVAVNHLKSKSCGDATGSNADQGDGQGCWSPTRVQAASRIADWLRGAPTGVADAGVLIVGDLNAYAQEDPITTLAAHGYANMLARHAGAQAYSYVFSGESGNLDHALADATASATVVNTQAWHINADEPLGLQYTRQYKSDAQQASFYAPDAYRSSDHDPVVVDLALAETSGGGDGDGGGTTPPASGDGGGSIGLLAALLAACGVGMACARRARAARR